MNIFLKNIVWTEWKTLFLVTFNITISYIFPKFHWNSSGLSEDMNFYFFQFNNFRQFLGFIYLYLRQKN